MVLAHLRILIHEFLDKDPNIFTDKAPITILHRKSVICMAKNGKHKNHTSYIARRVYFVINGEKWKMHRIEWCEGGLQLSDIAAKNIGKNDLNQRMKYIVVSLEKW